MTDAPIASDLDRRRSQRRTWAWTAVALGATALGVAALARPRTPPEPPPVLGQVPGFTLVERSGKPLTSEGLRGRLWVADFMFTRCAGACPAMTARMARLRRQVPAEVIMVSFTVDPAYDTSTVLSDYAQRAGADEGWLFATGVQDDLYRLATEGFKLAAQAVPPEQQAGGDGPFLHSSHFVLVDGRGRLRGYYDSTDEGALQTLLADLAALRAEAS